MSLYASGGAENAAAVVTSDVTVIAPTIALFVGGAGTLTVVMVGGQTVTFTGVIAGSVLPVRVTAVKATGTTATNITALW